MIIYYTFLERDCEVAQERRSHQNYSARTIWRRRNLKITFFIFLSFYSMDNKIHFLYTQSEDFFLRLKGFFVQVHTSYLFKTMTWRRPRSSPLDIYCYLISKILCNICCHLTWSCDSLIGFLLSSIQLLQAFNSTLCSTRSGISLRLSTWCFTLSVWHSFICRTLCPSDSFTTPN